MPEVISGLWFVGPVFYFVMAGAVLCVIVILFLVPRGDEDHRKTAKHQKPNSPT